jgi:hypothetical protein
MRWTIFALVALLPSLTGCATKIAEFRHPTTGQIGRCQPNPEAVMGGALAMVKDGNSYAECKTAYERQGYVRTPAGQETDETKQMIRDIDEARANSIRK